MDFETFGKSYQFILTDIVQWGDLDAFQHVNNTMYFRYFERVRFAFFKEYKLLDEMNSSGIGQILASTQCRFRKPLEYPDTIHIGTRISALEEDRFMMNYGIFSEQLDSVAAEGEGFIIYYNYNKKVKTPMPDDHYGILTSLGEQED